MFRSSHDANLGAALGSLLFRRQAALAPAGDAARQEPIGPAEVVQPDRLGINRVDRSDGFQQHRRQTRADLGPVRQFGRHVLADHQARPVFDDLKALAEDRRIVAQVQAAGDERQRVRQARQDTELARHVVSAGGELAHRRPAQHGGLAVEVDQVVQVGQAAGELARRGVFVQMMAVCRQIEADRAPVQGNALGGGSQAGFDWHAPPPGAAVGGDQYRRKRMTQPAGSAELSVRQGGVGIDVVKSQADIDFRHP